MISRIAGPVRAALAIVALASVLLTAPAHAQDGPGPVLDPVLRAELESIDDELERFDTLIDAQGWALSVEVTDEALDLLVVEIALLERLDAFNAPVQAVGSEQAERILEAFAPWPDVSPLQLRAALDDVDRALAALKNDMLAELGDTARPLFTALDEIPVSWRNRLTAGEQRFIPRNEYIVALSLLLTEGTAPALGQIGLQGLEMGAPLDEVLDGVHESGILASFLFPDAGALGRRAPLLDAPAQDTTPWPLIAGVAAGVVLLLGVTVRRRRRRRTTPDEAVSHRVLEAHRRLTGSVDEDEIAGIAVGASVEATDADGGILLRTAVDGLRIAGSTTLLVGSILDRVVETGQPLLATPESDPVCQGRPAALAAVPIVADRRIEGVLVAWRQIDEPFTVEARREMELIAPAIGGALTSADAVGSAQSLAMIDGLTSLGNRRRLDGDLETTLTASLRSGSPVAFAMIDVDDFKSFNDTHGHAAGDIALQSVANVIASCVRAGDVVYRYGGEEFSVLLPGATVTDAVAVAERVRAAVESSRVPGEEFQPGGRLTVSIGVATMNDGTEGSGSATGNEVDLKKRADDALYRAKSEGRNRVAVA